MLRKLRFHDDHVCPWWLAFTFDNPLRRWLHPPERILGALVRPGMTVADIGCGMGYFSVAMAQMVGPNGRVMAVDLQQKMLDGVQQRGERLGLAPKIILHRATPHHIGLPKSVDFALAFWMVHEVPDQARFFSEIEASLNPGGKLLLVEPRLHVGTSAFEQEVALATASNLHLLSPTKVGFSRAMLFAKVSQES